MKKYLKASIKLGYYRLVNPLLKIIISPLFDKKYLGGRYFDKGYQGWFWVLRSIFTQKLLGFNRKVPWPVSPFISIDDPLRVIFDLDDLNNFQHFGCYYANYGGGRITIGKGTWIAPNVGIITTDHGLDDPSLHTSPQDVVIGEKCWIGMNSVILKGVHLGNNTVVGAGAVVTKSYPEGHCVIAGVPAKIVRKLN